MDQQELFSAEPEKWSLYQYAKLREPPAPPMDASERERRLTAALSRAKEQLAELRSRLVRADCVAQVWMERALATQNGDHSAEVACGAIMRRILSAENDQSLKTALDELRHQARR